MTEEANHWLEEQDLLLSCVNSQNKWKKKLHPTGLVGSKAHTSGTTGLNYIVLSRPIINK